MDWGKIILISALVAALLCVAIGGWLTWQRRVAERASE